MVEEWEFAGNVQGMRHEGRGPTRAEVQLCRAAWYVQGTRPDPEVEATSA